MKGVLAFGWDRRMDVFDVTPVRDRNSTTCAVTVLRGLILQQHTTTQSK